MVKRGRPSSKQSDHSLVAKKAKDSLSLLRKKKPCEKAHCPCKEPRCFAQASDKCSGNLWTPRWFHLSEDEHYCNECFEHFCKPSRAGYAIFSLWKELWVRDLKGETAIRLFMADQLLPFWLQCIRCDKWRQLPARQVVTESSIRDFTCDQMLSGADHSGVTSGEVDIGVSSPCEEPEPIEAGNAVLPHWINTLSLAPMLKTSPAAPLLANYNPLPLGITASKLDYLSEGLAGSAQELREQLNLAKEIKEPFVLGVTPRTGSQVDLVRDNLTHPFLEAGEELIAGAMRPDAMEEHEKVIFSEYSKEQAMFLCLRNLVYSLWMRDPTSWLTIKEVAINLQCRGLSRIRCLYEAQRILHHLTQRGLVNHGHLCPPPDLPRLPPTRVVVVGAGAAGLAAGRHLSNLGMKVTVLEVGDRIGGRINYRKRADGLTLATGADRLVGVINNPFTILALQCGVLPIADEDNQMMLQPGGTLVDLSVDEAVDDLFARASDALLEWRHSLDQTAQRPGGGAKKGSNPPPPPPTEPDIDLEKKITQLIRQANGDKSLTKEEKPVLESYKSLIETSCGASLSKVSAKMYAQYALCPQFAGGTATVPGGLGALSEDLSSGLEVRLRSRVTSVELLTPSNGTTPEDTCRARVSFTTDEGKQRTLDADYVVVAVPLYVLQKGAIRFTPSLPAPLIQSLNQFGCGQLEQVVAEFPHSFWRPSNQDHRCGLILRTLDEKERDQRGMFPMFVDVSAHDRAGRERFLLKSYIIGDSVEQLRSLNDQEVSQEYVKVLRKIFGEIPEPLQCHVSRFCSNDHIGMAYTYPKVGFSSAEELRPLSCPVMENAVFLAGEHLNQNMCRSVAGAYQSGLDAAARIVHRCLYGDDVPYIQSGL
ncbi:lysine-specific histone demethylase 1B-like [Tropilaelaps mercedesae]|uniref:Lysine-specific histone demethylase 1B-like n=1 Tax=Tropilaelaps mercedesae TaxID=418985 RepID=A0A1V9XNK9_9ACAR|nr:lysine-specific histone demethylase 1B-like [Tropilaelaps mercedesae]